MTPHPDLLTSFETGEDAGVVRIAPDRALVLTADFFPPIVDDPFTFGRIVATNALSDVYAMGGRPIAALNLLSAPKDFEPEALGDMLAGGAEMVKEAGAVIAGGHTIEDVDVKYGLAVTGEVHPDRVVYNRGVQPNDFLVLTKPIGTGLITSSIKAFANNGPEVEEAIRWMTTLNSTGLDLILEAGPHAMTDVTGFGLLGHLSEMLGDEPLLAKIEMSDIPRIPGVERCFKKRCRTRASAATRRHLGVRLRLHRDLDEWDQELLFDPQTAGGLLIALPPSRAESLARRLRSEGLEHARVIGSIVKAEDGEGPRIQILAEPPPRSFTRH